MMDVKTIREKLEASSSLDPNFLQSVAIQFADAVKANKLKIIELVQELNPILTNGNHETRLKGVEILSQLIITLPNDYLIEQELKVLNEFLCLRLIDHSSMEQPALKCLSYFIDCTNKPVRYNRELLDYFKSKLNIRAMSNQNRMVIYRIIEKMVKQKYQLNATLDCDFVYSIVGLMEGESEPKSLMLCFSIVSYILKNFKDLEPYVDDMFEWMSSYYPIDYTPNGSDQSLNIQKSDLNDALYECFYANELNCNNLMEMLLEKLDSKLISTKLECLNCIQKCCAVFSVQNMKSFATSIWSPIRMECLKKIDSIDLTLSKPCYELLTALANNLKQDEDFYYQFVFDMYDEISISFRKLELDLYEPAARIIAHIIAPKLKAFNYVLNKILPSASASIHANGIGVISGLGYILRQVTINHPGEKLNDDINIEIDKIVGRLIERIDKKSEILDFITILIDQKFEFDQQTLTNLIEKLFNTDSTLDLGACLAKICLNYKKLDVVFDDRQEYSADINELIRSIQFFQDLRETNSTYTNKFSIYLKMLIMILNDIERSNLKTLNPDDVDSFLLVLRDMAIENKDELLIVEHIADIHGILFNKLEEAQYTQSLMKFFSSDYCQALMVPEKRNYHQTYIKLLRMVLKSLMIGNSKFSIPLINLVLNYITSDNVNENDALHATSCFSYVHVQDNSSKFTNQNHYKVFKLYKQKFYTQTCKEIKLRYEKEESVTKKYLLICCLASQIPLLPPPVYKKDYAWLLRELLQLLTSLETSELATRDHLVAIIYDCMISLIQHDSSENLEGLLYSVVNSNLKFSTTSKKMEVRRRAIGCLTVIASSFKHTELLTMRNPVVDKLRDCLSDKKRLVRQAAAEARLKWILIGQPVGV